MRLGSDELAKFASVCRRLAPLFVRHGSMFSSTDISRKKTTDKKRSFGYLNGTVRLDVSQQRSSVENVKQFIITSTSHNIVEVCVICLKLFIYLISLFAFLCRLHSTKAQVAVRKASNFPRNCRSLRKIQRMSKRVMLNQVTPRTRATVRAVTAHAQRIIFCRMKLLYSTSYSTQGPLLC